MGDQTNWDFTDPTPRSTPPKGKETFSSGVETGKTEFNRVKNQVQTPPTVAAGFLDVGGEFHITTFLDHASDAVDLAVLDGAFLNQPLVGSATGPAVTPRAQSIRRQVDQRGEASQGNGELLDPVDPVTGEFIISHVDLEFPSFGVPFRFTRTYRSRVDYDGPLGPAWDHVYNQRLYNAPELTTNGSPPPPVVYTRLGIGVVGPMLSPPDGDCGPTLLLTTGEGTTLTFHETARTGATISYRSNETLLTLVGTDAPAGPTWTLKSPQGDVRSFDADGHLVRWVDSNDVGLVLTWEGIGNAARVVTVTDSAGRLIELEYDASRRLLRVGEETSGLEATYSYAANGALDTVRDGAGHGERYEYDYNPARGRGAWVPEEQLRPACAAACAVSDGTCEVGGACDEPVSDARAACIASLDDAKDDCGVLCRAAYANPSRPYDPTWFPQPCNQYCWEDPAAIADLENECQGLYVSEGVSAVCQSCDESCEIGAEAFCQDLIDYHGTVYTGSLTSCTDSLADCCADGDSCATGSCNAGTPCEVSCQYAFLGFQAVGESCSNAENTPPSGCLFEAMRQCSEECGIDKAAVQCIPECQAGCTPAACDALDLASTCEDSCTESCIEEGRAPVDGISSPRYGQQADLNFNIIRVYDGAGQLYLQNTYGTTLSSPDFDSVTAQIFGETTPKIARWDFIASDDGIVTSSLPGWAAPLIVPPGPNAIGLDICPFGCRDNPALDELLAPIDGMVLVFADLLVPAPTSGFLVNRTLSKLVSPTLVTFSTEKSGAVIGTISRRTSTTNFFATTATTLPMTLDGGANVTLTTSTTGRVTVTGSAAGKAQLLQMRTMTLFTDPAKRVQAYPGTPREVLKISNGACTAPFKVQRVSDTEVQLTPSTACQGEIWLTPMAGAYPDQAQAAVFPRDGLAALSTSAFHPTALSPTRDGFIWRQGIDGRRVREAAPTAAGRTDARTAATTQYTKAPMFSAPTLTSGSGEPLFVFHHALADYRLPPPPPSDSPWSQLDPVQGPDLRCDPTLPTAPVHGGPIPTQATAITDVHGARWTFYADEDSNILTTVNHETAAAWRFNYDPLGQLVGVLHPDQSRTCMILDDAGNMTRRIRMPATVAGMATPAPIVEEYRYSPANGELIWIGDPRTGGISRFKEIRRDARGNPTLILEADDTPTTLALVGGTTAVQAQIASIVRPGNVQTLIGYDEGTGTTSSVTVNAPGSPPMNHTIDHDEAGRPVVEVSPLGFEQTRSFDGPLLAFTAWDDDAGHAGRKTMSYDDDGQVTSILVGTPGSERLRTELSYDVTGALTTVKQIALDGSAATTIACQDMGPNGRLRETVSGEGIRVRYTRDGEGRVLSIQRGDLGPSIRAWDDACLAHPTGGTQSFTLATFVYDTSGRMISSTDERGRITTITYDGLGRPVIENRPDGMQARRGYDALGNVSWEALYTTASAPFYRPPSWADSGLQAATEYVHDNRARISEVRRWHFEAGQVPVGDGYATTRFTYSDADHSVTRTDDAGNAWITRDDGAGRPVEEKAPDGTTRSYSYPDLQTVRISEPGPAGATTRELALTRWGDIASEAARIGTTNHALASAQFDHLLRPISTTGLTGESTAVTYDALGRIKTQQQIVPGGAGETLTLGYNRDGQPLTRMSAANAAITGTWGWTYDALGREIRAVDPGNGAVLTTYVVGSQLPSVVTDQRGVQFQHSWATTANQLSLFVVDPAGPDVSASYVWDGRGNLVSAQRTDQGQPSVINAFTFDSLGDKVKETDNQLPIAWTRHAQYNGRGLLAKTTVNTTSWSRSYDTLGRLADIKVGTESNPIARYTYAGFDFRSTRALGNGLETRYQYDTLGRQVGQTDIKPTSGVTSASWGWQVPLDGVPRRADFRRTGASVSPGDNAVFTVDAALRLLKEDGASAGTFGLSATTPFATANTTASSALGAQTWHYGLDGHSAWTQRIRGTTGTTTYTRDSRDALTRVNTTNVTLDARGAIKNDGSIQVVYDAIGMPSSITTGTSSRAYRRDALGRIVSETDQAGQITRYAYDGPTRIVRQRPNGTTFDLNVDGAALDEHVAMITGATRLFLHQDRLGSVYLVTDAAGATKEWTSYSAYGEATLRSPDGTPIATNVSAVAAQFGFNGLPHDFITGTVDMRARTYRPVLGRFLSPDPLGLIDGTNRFAFVGASPLSFRDPFGLKTKHGGGGSHRDPSVELIKELTRPNLVGELGVAIDLVVTAHAPSVPAPTRMLTEFVVPIDSIEGCAAGDVVDCAVATAGVGSVGVLVGLASKGIRGLSRHFSLERTIAEAGQEAFAGYAAWYQRVTASSPIKPAHSAHNAANSARLSSQLASDEAASIFTAAGELKPEIVALSRVAIVGDELKNLALVQTLTADGSKLADWAKWSTPSVRSPAGNFQVHFYKNAKTGAVYYGHDYKLVFKHEGKGWLDIR